MKKHSLFILILVLYVLPLSAQSWQWAKGGGGDSYDYGNNICVDKNGNTYIAGMLEFYTAYFETIQVDVNGFNDMFIAKYGPDGTLLWVKQFGGPNSVINYDSEADCRMMYDSITNALYLTGKYYTECYFGSYHFTTAPNDWNMFVAKFDTDGNCQWAKTGGSNGGDAGYATAVNPAGTVFLIGGCQYAGIVDTIHVSAGKYLAKFSRDGGCIYARKTFLGFAPTDIKVIEDDVFIVGHTYDSIVSIDSMIYNVHKNHERALVKLDTLGNVKWVKFFGGPENYDGWKFAIDRNGNCYIPSVFTGSLAVFENDTLYSQGWYKYYLAKFDRNGNTKWVKTGNVVGGVQTNDIYCDNDYIYMCGALTDSVTFGSYTVVQPTLWNLYVARYDSAGNCLGVINNAEARGKGVTRGNDGFLYITGEYLNTINFGLSTLVSNGSWDAFVAKVAEFTGLNAVNKTPEGSQLIIYANPNSGTCNIQIPDEFMYEDNLVLSIYNLTGVLIQQQTLHLEENKVLLNLEAEAKGVYMATLSNGKTVYSGKIIFE